MQTNCVVTILLLLSSSCQAMHRLGRHKMNTNTPTVVYMTKWDALRAHNHLNCAKEKQEGVHVIPIDQQKQKELLDDLERNLDTQKTNLKQEDAKKVCKVCGAMACISCCCGCVGGCMLSSLVMALFL